jgi:myo-inositol-1(or 4)-monophosphatase
MDFQSFITDSLTEASSIAKEKFGSVSSSTKPEDNNQVLTEADIAIGEHLVGKVRDACPDYNIIDEEAGVIDKNSEFTWVIDPIDGTSNFASGIPTYGIIMGLLKGAVPIAGGVALPYFNEIYVAEKTTGAFCNGERIYVTREENLLSTLVAYTIDGHQEEPSITRDECKLIAEIVLEIRNLRASGSVFDGVMVAKGKYGGYLNRTSKIWDNVGQQILIEEAGGIYTDFFGKPIDYSNPLARIKDNYTFCTASPILHKKLQEIVAQESNIAQE